MNVTCLLCGDTCGPSRFCEGCEFYRVAPILIAARAAIARGIEPLLSASTLPNGVTLRCVEGPDGPEVIVSVPAYTETINVTIGCIPGDTPQSANRDPRECQSRYRS